MTEDEAYIEIAKKLMKLTDVLVQLETCIDIEIEKKYDGMAALDNTYKGEPDY